MSTTRRAWLIGIVALVVIALAATALVLILRNRDTTPAQPAPPPEPTIWQRLESSADENGRMPLDPALQAFAYVFGDMPGVAPPTGRPDDPAFTVSGSGPLRWVLGHWDELTEEQRRAVGRVFTASDDRPRLAGPRLLDLQPEPKEDTYRLFHQEITRLSSEIGMRLGYKLIPEPVLHLTEVVKKESTRAYSTVVADGVVPHPDGLAEGTWTPTAGRNAHTCHIWLPPYQWESFPDQVSPGLRATLAHEIIHCYQGFNYPNRQEYDLAPGWVIEGGAEFGGVDIAGSDEDGHTWRPYLRELDSLLNRTYSGMGWWFHLQYKGHDPWKALPRIWSNAHDAPLAYKTAGGHLDNVEETWASSLLRRPEFGPDWDVHGKDVPPDVPQRWLHDAWSSNRLPVAPYDVRIAEVMVVPRGDDAVVRVSASKSEPVRLHDNGSFEQRQVVETYVCVGKNCVCPEKTKRAGQRVQQVQAPLWLAVPGGETGNNAVAQAMNLRDYCEEDDKPDPYKEYFPGSAGDPHLTTFDGRVYEFQAGGEFTLARSESGDLEIQARQESVRANDGKEDLTISMNTAVAVRAGKDRVGVYATPDGLRVRINGGGLEDLSAEKRLPDGGSAAKDGDNYTVRWPDGTTITAVPIPSGRVGLNLLVAPAETRKAALRGLLGPSEDRAGKRYENPTWDQLYKEIGESWRIRQEDSLFDYEPGQSTETFTRRDMPTRPVELTPEQRAAGEKACAAINSPSLREQCVFDVGLTGDLGFVEGYSDVQKVISRGGIGDGATVSGDIGKPDEVDSYDLELPAGQEFRLADEQGEVQVKLVGADQTPNNVESMRLPGVTGFRVTQAGTYQLQVTGTGQYSFRVHYLSTRRADLRLGEKVTARLDAPGRVQEYAFDAGDATEITVHSDQCEAISVALVEDGAGPPSTPYPGCQRVDAFFSVEPGKRYVLVVWSDKATNADFTFQLDRT